MSAANAIAAVTATLRNLLTQGVTVIPELADTTVTTLPMDRARDGNANANQLNVFLYLAMPNAAWRNMDMPRQVNRFETGQPPLALNLYYLITAYGRENDLQSPFSHLLLGQAMSVLHDHPVLGVDEIRLALPDNDLYLQLERVRFTLQPLTVEEIFKLWSGFQTQYRLSASYEAAVVLIDSTRATRAPLPVLARGQGDTGVFVQADRKPPFPEIEKIVLPNAQPSAVLGDTLIFSGSHLEGDALEAVFTSTRLTAPVRVPAVPGANAGEFSVKIDDTPAKWVAGLYSVALDITTQQGTTDERVRTSNQMPLAIAPAIVSAFPLKAATKSGVTTIKLTCSPEMRVEQRVALLVGGTEILSEPRREQTADLTFVVTGMASGTYPVRLRVDGVDSLLVDRSVFPPVYRDHKAVIK